METLQCQILVLELKGGKSPFNDWLEGLDRTTQARIKRRVGRLRLGNFGDWRSVGEGVFELRLHFGAGYRVYFAKCKDEVVILLTGSDKKKQNKVIEKAKQLWKDHKDEIERFQKGFA